MTVLELKKKIAALKPPAQAELIAFLLHLKLQRAPEHAAEMARRRDDRNSESWVRLEDFEAQLAGGQESLG